MYARLTFFGIVLATVLLIPSLTAAQAILTGTATTTLTLSICGNSLVDDGEQCDVPGETGVYSTTIAGRQCSLVCNFGPYCGDGILQTSFGEECDDGNNDNADFCSAICKIEPAGSILQIAEQKSALSLLPSSHSSPKEVCKIPSPQ